MFFVFPLHISSDLRQLVLLLNTLVLIGSLITVELIYSERPKAERAHLRHFYPLFIVLIGLLVYAAYLQGAKS